ncbi:MAG: class A beta-lactamase [Acidobacteria bacterium]|nr:class A beta-lactamase [Acidobacteriota bacterium]
MKYLFLVMALFLSACGGAATNETNQNQVAPIDVPITGPAATPIATPAVKPPADVELEKQFAEIAKDAKGKVGVAAVVLETGENASLNGGEKFAMQSVYKVPISMAVMKQVDAGKFKSDQEIEITKEDFVLAGQGSLIRDENPNGTKMPLWHVIEYAIGESDGTASDVLLRILGGADEVQKYVDEIGVKDMTIKNTEKEFAKDWKTQYENSSTPAAAVSLLIELRNGVSLDKERSKLILDFMNESRPGPNRLRGQLPESAYVAHKTGTSGTQKGITAATNDIGVIALPNGKFMVIAVFVGDSPADEKTRESVIAKIGKAAWDKWGK